MITVGILEKISEILTLGTVEVYEFLRPSFVDFGEIQTIPWGQAQSYDLSTTVSIYLVVGESLDPDRERTFVGVPQARPLFVK